MATENPSDEQFEDIDWDAIDAASTAMTRVEAFQSGSLGLFVLLELFLLYDYLVDAFNGIDLGVVELGMVQAPPLVGMTIGPDLTLLGITAMRSDWLLLSTLLVMVAYGVVPLYQNPRLSLQYWRQFRKNRAAVISGLYLLLVMVVGIVGPMVMSAPELSVLDAYQPPMLTSVDANVPNSCVGAQQGGICQGTFQHPLGTTSSGKDILTMIVFGMRVSIEVAFIATMMIIVIATVIGTVAAYHGGYVDEALMRYVDIQLSFPEFPLYLLLVYLFTGSLFLLIHIFGLFSWGGIARIVRSETLQRREEEYIKAANSAGASSFYIIRRHIVPNVSNNVITATTLVIPGLILAEASLSFLGLGDPNVTSWGQIIAAGRGDLSTAWWISTVPGFFLFFTILAFNFVGDALRDALDPRHSGGGE